MSIEDEIRKFNQTMQNFGMGGEGGGQQGHLTPIAHAHWNPPEHGNTGEYAWNFAFRGAQLAIALANAVAQQDISEKQFDLAESWYNHAEYKWDRFKGTYMPLEKKLLKEVSTAPVPKLNCKDARNRANDTVNTSYAIMQRYMNQKIAKYGVCMNESLQKDLQLKQSIMLVDSENYNYNDDRWFRDFKDDQRWNRRSNILTLGRNLSSLAQSYGQAASRMFGLIGKQLDAVGMGAMTSLGYYGARRDTYIPSTFLGSAGEGATGSVNRIGVPGNIAGTALNPSGYGG